MDSFGETVLYVLTFVGVIFSPIIMIFLVGVCVYFELTVLAVILVVLTPVVFVLGVSYLIWRFFGNGAY